MKKSTIVALNAYLNLNDATIDIDAIKAEIAAEVGKMNEKSNAKMSVYEEAKPIVMNALSYETPMTVKDIVTACGDTLPADFTTHKVQYALLRYWNTEVKKIDNGKNPNTYLKI